MTATPITPPAESDRDYSRTRVCVAQILALDAAESRAELDAFGGQSTIAGALYAVEMYSHDEHGARIEGCRVDSGKSGTKGVLGRTTVEPRPINVDPVIEHRWHRLTGAVLVCATAVREDGQGTALVEAALLGDTPTKWSGVQQWRCTLPVRIAFRLEDEVVVNKWKHALWERSSAQVLYDAAVRGQKRLDALVAAWWVEL